MSRRALYILLLGIAITVVVAILLVPGPQCQPIFGLEGELTFVRCGARR